MRLPRDEYRISIISGCNMKCVYCHNEGNKTVKVLSKEDIDEILKNSLNLGIKCVRITGGEPLIHKQINEICELIKNKYGLKVGINTNCIEIEKLKELVKLNLIDRVVVGLDYFDAAISKNSPVGKSSKEILDNILEIKNMGIDISISKVYNGDIDNTLKIVEWGIEKNIRIKIIEEVKNEFAGKTSEAFIEIRDIIIQRYNLLRYLDPEFNEIHGTFDGEKIVSFFHSHCRVGECNICQKMQLRIGADKTFKKCIHYSEFDKKIEGDFQKNIEEMLNFDMKKIIIKRREV